MARVDGAFADVLAGNAAYAQTFASAGVPAPAAWHLAVVTCMDSRIDPLAVLGLGLGDAKVLRTPAARVTDDVLTALVAARWLLAVERVMVLAHTRCAMAGVTAEQVRAAVSAAGGPDTHEVPFLPAPDQDEVLRADVERVRSSPYLPGMAVGGFRYDVDTGRVSEVTADS